MAPKNGTAPPEGTKLAPQPEMQPAATIVSPPAIKAAVPLTDAGAHYNSLISYFKYLVTITMAAIALGVSVFLFATF